jgi:hypothetical protein
MVVFDATMLLLLLRPYSGRALDPSGVPIAQVEERIAHLVQRLEKAKTRIVIPTPALSEVLVRAGSAAPQIVETLGRSALFKIIPFDSLAAIEAAMMTRAAIDAGDKRGGLEATWAKIKFDRQIIAIAKVVQAREIYSDDADVRALAMAEDITVIGLAELPTPPEKVQIEMRLEPPTQEQEPTNLALLDDEAAVDNDSKDEPGPVRSLQEDSTPDGTRRLQGEPRGETERDS